MNRTASTSFKRQSQRGMTLVELLVTLLLISVGLLGVAALELTTLKGNQEAHVRSQATMLAGFILDRMRANQRGFNNGEYNNIDLNGTGTSGTTSGADLTRWQEEIDRLLPGDAATKGGTLNRGAGTNIVTVTIQWGERGDRVLGEAAGTRTFQTRTEI